MNCPLITLESPAFMHGECQNSGNGNMSQLVINVDNFQPINESSETKPEQQKSNNSYNI